MGFGINGYFYGVALDDAAFVHFVVPTYPEVMPTDCGLGDKPARVLGPLSTPSFHQGVSHCPR